MPTVLSHNPASGAPGIDPKWTRSNKHGLGTAFSKDSHIWYTVSKGIINEVYFPTIDTPQVRDLQFLFSDGQSFFHGERQLESVHECLELHTLGYRITNVDPAGRFRIKKEVIAATNANCLLIHSQLEVDAELKDRLQLYALIAPHLQVGGQNNHANIVEDNGRRVLVAHKGDAWLAVAATIPFVASSCGYVGRTDGWTDLSRNLHLTFDFDCAPDGNVALVGQLDCSEASDFTLALSFGSSLADALNSLNQSLAIPFKDQLAEFARQWHQGTDQLPAQQRQFTNDDGRLLLFSTNLIRAHEDKTFNGAIIASLSIPWGECRGDKDIGGYHLVWTRDMCHSATGLLAAGIVDVPLRALIYLESTQNADGGFYQNFWVNGTPNWHGVQLDETAFPIILAWQLHQAGALRDFDSYPMVLRSARFLIENGPVTPQERWEENGGFSPSTLAAMITALICAAEFAQLNGHEMTAQYLVGYADFLESHLEQWTVTTEGTLVPGITRHFIRLHPADPNDVSPNEDANQGNIELRNIQPGLPRVFAAKDIVDAGFLALVRFGIRKADDKVIEDSVSVIDQILKVETPVGVSWRRYNHDGYGQKATGDAFQHWGHGHAWPVLTGERGHYELSAGHDPRPYIRAMENFASDTKLLPEQVWALPDIAEKHMFLGRPTGGAMPLAWAHAEYLQLVRSLADGKVFNQFAVVANRYPRPVEAIAYEIWQFNRQVRRVASHSVLRIQAKAAFQASWTCDNWLTVKQVDSVRIETGHEFVDIEINGTDSSSISFTFFWKDANRWENRNFDVEVIR